MFIAVPSVNNLVCVSFEKSPELPLLSCHNCHTERCSKDVCCIITCVYLFSDLTEDIYLENQLLCSYSRKKGKKLNQGFFLHDPMVTSFSTLFFTPYGSALLMKYNILNSKLFLTDPFFFTLILFIFLTISLNSNVHLCERDMFEWYFPRKGHFSDNKCERLSHNII